MTRKTIVITGGGGKLASRIFDAGSHIHSILLPDRTAMDVVRRDNVSVYLDHHKPIDYVIHCAALTRPMALHDEFPARSIEVNIIGTCNVVLECMARGIKLIYISTDYVYPGDDGHYKETDPVLPHNKYAWSKLGGECAVMAYNNSLILRSAIVSYPYPHRYAYDNVYKSAIYDIDAAPLILKLLDETGIINLGGPKRTLYEFASGCNAGRAQYIDGGHYVAKDCSMNTDKLIGCLSHA